MVELGTFCEAKLGKALNARANEGAQAWPYLRNVNVQWGRVDLCDVKTMHFTERERSVLRLQRGDLLVCEGGEVGRAAIWEGEIAECYFQNALHRLRPDQARCLTEYLFYQMLWKAQTDGFREFTTRATIAHLSGEKLARVPIPLPPLEEQRRIVDVLNRAAGIRRLREAALAKARDTIPALFLSMFGDPATNPKGWPVRPFGEFVRYSKYGPRFPKEAYGNSGAHVLRTTDMDPFGGLRWWEAPMIALSDHDLRRHALAPRTLLVTRTGTIGRLALFRGAEQPCIAGAYLIEFGLSDDVVDDFIESFFLSAPVQAILQSGSRSMTLANLNAPTIMAIHVPSPPLPLQQEFAARLADLRGIVAQAERALGLARDTERALMAHLLG